MSKVNPLMSHYNSVLRSLDHESLGPWPENLYLVLLDNSTFGPDDVETAVETRVPVWERWFLHAIFVKRMTLSQVVVMFGGMDCEPSTVLLRASSAICKLDDFLHGRCIPPSYGAKLTISRCARLPYPENVTLGAFRDDRHYDEVMGDMVTDFLDRYRSDDTRQACEAFLDVFRDGHELKSSATIYGFPSTGTCETKLSLLLRAFKAYVMAGCHLETEGDGGSRPEPEVRTVDTEPRKPSFDAILVAGLCTGVGDLVNLYPPEKVQELLQELADNGIDRFTKTGELVLPELWFVIRNVFDTYGPDGLNSVLSYADALISKDGRTS